MKPSIGRIVHYNSAVGPAAALVIDVDGAGDVTLQVFYPDGYIVLAHRIEQGTELGQWDWPPRT